MMMNMKGGMMHGDTEMGEGMDPETGPGESGDMMKMSASYGCDGECTSSNSLKDMMSQHTRAQNYAESFAQRSSWNGHRMKQAAMSDKNMRMETKPPMRHHPNKPVGD